MIPGARLIGERLSRFRALGVQGEPAWRYAGQLRAALIGRLGQEHADLLAVPQIDESGERIDWYAPFDGPAVSVDQLPPQERSELEVRARRLQEDMEALAQQLSVTGRSDAERNFARLLRHALTIPARSMLFSVSGRPVFAFWGFAGDATQVGPVTVSPAAWSAGTTPPPPAEAAAARSAVLTSGGIAATAVSPSRDGWRIGLLAFVLLVLLAVGAWLIKPHLPVLMGLEHVGRQAAIEPPAGVADADLRPRQAALARASETAARLAQEFTLLGGDLRKKQAVCTPGSVGAVVGPSGEIVAADGQVVGRIVAGSDGGAVVVAGPEGRPILGADGKPVDARSIAEMAARDRLGPGQGIPGGIGADGARRDGTDAAQRPGTDLPRREGADGMRRDGTDMARRDGTDMARREGSDAARRNGSDMARREGAEAARRDAVPPGQRGPQPPAAKPPEPKIEKPLTVPQDARRRGDVGFLQGDWRSRSTLTTQRGEEDIRINYEFDDKGKGKSVIVQQNGVTCEAPASARFDRNGKLVIEEQANPTCSDGTGYVKSTVTCDVGKEGGAADCVGRNDSGKTYSVQIGK